MIFYAAPEELQQHGEGLDLVYTGDTVQDIRMGTVYVLPTGTTILSEHAALVTPRSGLATKGLTIVNSPGLVDSNYQGEIKVIMTNVSLTPYQIQPGDRIAQLLFLDRNLPVLRTSPESYEQTVTARSTNGFGSTGR